MLGRRKKYFENLSFGIDLVAAVGILGGLYLFLYEYDDLWQSLLRNLTGYIFDIQTVSHLSDQGWLFLTILFFHFTSLRLNRFYTLDLFARWTTVAIESLKCIVIGIALTTLFFYFFSILNFNRSLTFGFAGLFFAYHVIKEKLFRRYLLHTYYTQKPLEALLICPARAVSKRISKLSLQQFSSVKITDIILSDGTPEQLEAAHSKLVRHNFKELPKALSTGRFDLVFLGEGGRNPETAQQVISAAEEQGVEVWYMADFLEPILARPQVDEYAGNPVIVFKTTSHIEGKLIVKRAFDIVFASAAFLAVLPIFIAVTLAIKLDSKGPVFFSQERTGFKGKPFRMLKFRTMVTDAQARHAQVRDEANEMSGPVFKREDDPRITNIGRWLRRYSIDELPQLLNIIKGEMSLVGPRPLPTYETQKFEAFRDHRRYSVLPGLTGLWQISGRSSITDFREWVRLDLEYIDRWSLWLDIKILLKTFPVVLKGVGAK